MVINKKGIGILHNFIEDISDRVEMGNMVTKKDTTKKKTTIKKPVAKKKNADVKKTTVKKTIKPTVKSNSKKTAVKKKVEVKKTEVKKPVAKKKNIKENKYDDVNFEQSFFVCTGDVLNNLIQLPEFLDSLGNHDFMYHVNDDKDDFANWVEFVFGEKNLANKLRKTQNQNKYVKIIKLYLK